MLLSQQTNGEQLNASASSGSASERCARTAGRPCLAYSRDPSATANRESSSLPTAGRPEPIAPQAIIHLGDGVGLDVGVLGGRCGLAGPASGGP
jgi:hypothetical protein